MVTATSDPVPFIHSLTYDHSEFRIVPPKNRSKIASAHSTRSYTDLQSSKTPIIPYDVASKRSITSLNPPNLRSRTLVHQATLTTADLHLFSRDHAYEVSMLQLNARSYK